MTSRNYNYCVCVRACVRVCSAPTWNVRKVRIAQRKLGIPGLVDKVRIEQRFVQTLDFKL